MGSERYQRPAREHAIATRVCPLIHAPLRQRHQRRARPEAYRSLEEGDLPKGGGAASLPGQRGAMRAPHRAQALPTGAARLTETKRLFV